MNKKINESFSFLIKEYRRLKLKNKQKKISDEEKQTLRKLKSFIGKKDE
jgi:hypothetical protein|tara:strand:- start:1370 stop:1516 length:147 start_codon:yes stop_codon:yes gene_type:complete